MAIKSLDKETVQLILSDDKMSKAYTLLCSIPGIGSQIAAHLLVVTQCFTSFENSRQLCCYAGIAPFEYSSGTSIRGRTKVSHLANKSLKSLLNMAALNAVRLDKELHLYYERKKNEGKNGMVIMNAVRNKIVARGLCRRKERNPLRTTG